MGPTFIWYPLNKLGIEYNWTIKAVLKKGQWDIMSLIWYFCLGMLEDTGNIGATRI